MIKININIFILLVLAVSLVGCSDPESHAASNEIDSLKFELEKVRSEQRAMQDEISTIREFLSRLPTKQSPVVEAIFQPNGAEKNDPYRGNVDAPVLVMAFSDYQCKPCRDFVRTTLPKLERDFISPGTVQFILRDYPLQNNPHARHAASLAHCAGEQGHYWLMHDALIENAEAVDDGRWESLLESVAEIDRPKLERCASSGRYENEINDDIAAGRALGAKGAPGFFIGKRQDDGSFRGVFTRGAQPFQLFAAQIQHLLRGKTDDSSS